MDLTPSNLPPGTQLSVGTAVIEITATPHKGCAKFIQRYGRDACVFVNVDDGDKYKLRGIYARVVKDGQLSLGDTMKKLA
jgi:MOSC domain-containing protein YiiM